MQMDAPGQKCVNGCHDNIILPNQLSKNRKDKKSKKK